MRLEQKLNRELSRVGVDMEEALRVLMNRNDPSKPPLPRGEPVRVALDPHSILDVLAVLPDSAGTEAFVEAAFRAWAVRPGKPSPDGAGA